MVKKIKLMGGNHSPRCMRGLITLLLCFCFCFGISFPAYAASGLNPVESEGVTPYIAWRDENGKDYFTMGISLDGDAIQHPDITGYEVQSIWFFIDFDENFSQGDVLSCSYNSTLGNVKGNSFNARLVYDDGSRSPDVVSSGSSGTVNITFQKNSKGCQLVLYSTDLTVINDTTVTTRMDMAFSLASASEGILSSILDFIKTIPEKIGYFFTNLVENLHSWFDDVGDWFTQLGNNLQSWFDNVINNLKNWFDDVGDWFSELGNNIKSWFIDLRDKIGDFFDNLFTKISNFFTMLFKPSDDYFDNLRTDLDTFLTDHLGIVYELPVRLLQETITIYNAFSVADGVLFITVPAFEFDLLDHHYEIYEGGTHLLYQEGNMPWLDTILDIAHVMIDLTLAVGFVRFTYKKVINKVGVEGGDEI